MGAANDIRAHFAQAVVLDLAFPHQVAHRASHVFDRHRGIDTVLEEQVDGLDPQALQRRLGHRPDMRRSAVDAQDLRAPFGIQLEAELGDDRHLLAKRRQRFADEGLVRVRAVGFGAVEERDPALHGSSNQPDDLVAILRRAVNAGHAHATQSQR